jgi:hypothetical protein
MITAILIGQGPEVAAPLARADLLSGNLMLFRTNVSGATPETASRESAGKTPRARNVSHIIMTAPLKPANPNGGKGKSFTLLKRPLSRIFLPASVCAKFNEKASRSVETP